MWAILTTVIAVLFLLGIGTYFVWAARERGRGSERFLYPEFAREWRERHLDSPVPPDGAYERWHAEWSGTHIGAGVWIDRQTRLAQIERGEAVPAEPAREARAGHLNIGRVRALVVWPWQASHRPQAGGLPGAQHTH